MILSSPTIKPENKVLRDSGSQKKKRKAAQTYLIINFFNAIAKQFVKKIRVFPFSKMLN